MRPATADDIQCLAVTNTGKQCPFCAEEDSDYCRRHLHLSSKKRFEYAAATPLPRIPKSALFDLTPEVQLLKQLIAARTEMLTDPDSLIIYSGHISDLISKLQKLMDGAIKLEVAKGNLLSRTAAMALIGKIMNAVADVVTDIDQLDQIHEKINELIVEQSSEIPTE